MNLEYFLNLFSKPNELEITTIPPPCSGHGGAPKGIIKILTLGNSYQVKKSIKTMFRECLYLMNSEKYYEMKKMENETEIYYFENKSQIKV